MKRKLADALDESLTLISRGEATLEECLARHPDYAAELQPLLELAMALQQAPRPVASAEAYARGKARMFAALARQQDQSSGRVETRGAPGRQRHQLWSLPRPAWAALAIVLLLVAGALVVRLWPQTTIAHAATISATAGDVEMLRPGDEAWVPVPAGQPVKPGVRLRTGLASSAVLQFFDGSTTELEGETELALVRLNSQRDGGCVRIVLSQSLGSTHNLVHPLPDQSSCFQVETPAALVAVRGSEFIVRVGPGGSTSVTVVEGVLDVTAADTTTTVGAGQETSVDPRQTPLPARAIAQPTGMPAENAYDEDEERPDHEETGETEATGEDHATGTSEDDEHESHGTPAAGEAEEQEQAPDDHIGEPSDDREHSEETQEGDGDRQEHQEENRDQAPTDDSGEHEDAADRTSATSEHSSEELHDATPSGDEHDGGESHD